MTSTQVNNTLKFAAENVDIENGIINNCILAQVGEAKGHGVHVEEKFIIAANQWLNANLSDKGLKCNIDHNWGSAMGKQAGKFYNFRAEAGKLIGDLHIYNAADKSPTLPNLKSWLLELASEDSEAINCSIWFYADYYYQLTEAGDEVQIWYYDDEDGWISKNPDLGNAYVAFDSMRCCDLVDEGALTETLFSTDDTLKNKFNDIIHNPGFMRMLESNPEQFPVLNEHYHKQQGNALLKGIKNFLFGKQKNSQMAQENKPTPEGGDAFDATAFSELQTAFSSIRETVETYEGQFSAIEKRLGEYTQRADALEQRLEALENAPAGDETTTDTDPAPPREAKPWENYDIPGLDAKRRNK